MWPFTPKTLYDRYSKLMKLIMSIDSHFEVTENKDNSVRLHLPNYKGNQPMDFHIYLMEPFLFISFVTEIEGEKVSTVNSYPKDMNQQDMFNAAMASNLEKVRQSIVEKGKKDNCNFVSTDEKESASKPVKERKETIGIINSWSLLAFAKEHGKMQVGDFANKDTGEVFKACIFTKPDGTRTFVAFAAKMGELTPKQIAEMKDELQVVQLESGNYSLCKIGTSSWENVNLQTFDSLNKNEESPNLQKQHEGIANITDSWEIYKLIKMSDEDKCDSVKNGLLDILTDENGVLYDKKQKVLLKAPLDIHKYSIKAGTERIDDHAFAECTELESIVIPDSLIVIGNYAFESCYSLRNLELPPSVKVIGEWSFHDCSSLTHVVISPSITKIGGSAFAECTSLESILIPNSVKTLGDHLFYRCKALKHITIPSSIETIEDGLFYGCSSLKEIKLPNSIIGIGEGVFGGCRQLHAIIIPEGSRNKFEQILSEYKDLFVEKHSGDNIQNGGFRYNPNVDKIELTEPMPYDAVEIDIGLSVLWAKMNIGASSEYENGLLYGYGDVSGKMTSESEDDYPKYDIANTEHDIAKTNWGNGWRMPKVEELDELVNKCKWKKIFKNGVWGAEVTGPNGNCIFLPLAGARMGSNYFRVGQIGMYWSGTMTKFGSHVKLMYYGEDAIIDGAAIASNGLSVRAVKNKNFSNDIKGLEKFQINKDFSNKENKRLKNSWIDDWGAKYTVDKCILLEVPYHIKEYSIITGTKSISSNAFDGCTEIKSLIIPNGIKKIENGTFRGCSSLMHISIPNSVEEIGDNVFGGCSSLANISIPNSLIRIGGGAFFGCKGLTSIFIPESVKEIGEDFLSECSNLTSIIVDERNPYYDSRNNCNAIIETKNNTLIAGCATTVVPKGVTKIAHQAFGGSRIKSVVLPEGLVEIEQSAFCACAELKTIKISDSVEVIGQLAFCGCESLISVKLPASIKIISESSFWDCKNLQSIIIPNSSKEKFEELLAVYKDLLIEESELRNVHSDETVQPNAWTDEHGVQYDREHKLLLKAPKDIEKYIVAEGTRTIGNAAFSNCEKLKSVILPDSVIEIGHYAFAGCTSIFSFAIPNRVTKLGNGIFMDCRKLSSIRIPAGLAVVENDIFQGCDNLDSVFVPADCKYKFDELLFGHDATTYEYNHQNKSEVEVLDNILHGIVDEYGVLYDFEEQILLSATQPLRDYSVKPDTIGIRVEAFKPDIWKRDNSSLKRLYLPDSVTMIGDAAFANNEGLEYINIPQETVIFTDDNPFAGCVNLHTIKWDSERTVKEGTLVYNEEKTALIACLPWQYIGGVTKSWTLFDFARQHGKMQVGEFTNKETGDVFKSCIFTNTNDGTRTYVAFSSAMGELTPQEIARQKNELIVVQLESGKYSLCKGKMSIQQESHVEVPYGIEKIAAHAFYKNDVLEIITFPPTLKAIGTDAFDGCSSLRVIYIPKGTLAKFEKIIPELRELMIERSDMLPF